MSLLQFFIIKFPPFIVYTYIFFSVSLSIWRPATSQLSCSVLCYLPVPPDPFIHLIPFLSFYFSPYVLHRLGLSLHPCPIQACFLPTHLVSPFFLPFPSLPLLELVNEGKVGGGHGAEAILFASQPCPLKCHEA